jgi:hypothetical protein
MSPIVALSPLSLTAPAPLATWQKFHSNGLSGRGHRAIPTDYALFDRIEVEAWLKKQLTTDDMTGRLAALLTGWRSRKRGDLVVRLVHFEHVIVKKVG